MSPAVASKAKPSGSGGVGLFEISISVIKTNRLLKLISTTSTTDL